MKVKLSSVSNARTDLAVLENDQMRNIVVIDEQHLCAGFDRHLGGSEGEIVDGDARFPGRVGAACASPMIFAAGMPPDSVTRARSRCHVRDFGGSGFIPA